MSAQSAAESLILEFVTSPEFESRLHSFMQSGSVRSDHMLGILRQFVNSPTCDAAHVEFWRSPAKTSPEMKFDDNNHE